MKGTAADWFESVSATIADNWNTGTNTGNNFVDLFKTRFINETKKNQWYQELSVLRQQTDESVDSYANKFKKLVSRIGMTDDVQKKRMFLMGLNPAYTPLVYFQNPVDLDAAVNSARTIEIGYNFATGRMPKNLNTTANVTNAIPKTTFASNEVDELTKRMKQLSLNYANLTTALLAQSQAPPRRRNFNNERNFPNERNFNNERNFSGNRSYPNTQRRPQPTNLSCFNYGKVGHFSRECTAPRQPRSNRNLQFENQRDVHLAEQYYDEECDYETEEEEEYEVYLNTRSRPYPKNPISKNRRKQSESQREELLRPTMTQRFSSPLIDEEMEAEPTLLLEPIEQLTEFNISTYLQNLPCELLVG